jgi:hypothetical protein
MIILDGHDDDDAHAPPTKQKKIWESLDFLGAEVMSRIRLVDPELGMRYAHCSMLRASSVAAWSATRVVSRFSGHKSRRSRANFVPTCPFLRCGQYIRTLVLYQ